MDLPCMVDPVRTDHWILAHSELHKEAKELGMRYDDAVYNSLLNWHVPKAKDITFYKPTTAQIDSMPKFCRARGDRYEPTSCNPGVLPVISKLRYDNALAVCKGRGDIEHEMREAARFTGARLFDKTGNVR